MRRILFAILGSLALIAGVAVAAPSAQAAPQCVRKITNDYDASLGNIKTYYLFTDLNSAGNGYGTFAQTVMVTDYRPYTWDFDNGTFFGVWTSRRVNQTTQNGTMGAPVQQSNGKWKMVANPGITKVESVIDVVGTSSGTIGSPSGPYPTGTDFTCPS